MSVADSVSANLSDLVQNVGELEVKVANTTNAFTLLSHSQFIENRTYMEDEKQKTAANEVSCYFFKRQPGFVPAVGNLGSVSTQPLIICKFYDTVHRTVS